MRLIGVLLILQCKNGVTHRCDDAVHHVTILPFDE